MFAWKILAVYASKEQFYSLTKKYSDSTWREWTKSELFPLLIMTLPLNFRPGLKV